MCFPFKARWCTIGRSLRALAMVGILSLLYNLPRFFEFDIVLWTIPGNPEKVYVAADPRLRNSTNHRTYMTVYYCACYLLTHFAIPFSILVVVNTFMILAVYKAHRQRRLLSNQEKREHKTAFMMILVILVFVCCNTLPFVLNFVEEIDPQFFESDDTRLLAWALNDVNNLLVIFNASTTAVIYAACSEKYRRLLLMLWMNTCPILCYPQIRGGCNPYSRATCRESPMERRTHHQSNNNNSPPPLNERRKARKEKATRTASTPDHGREPLIETNPAGEAVNRPDGDCNGDARQCARMSLEFRRLSDNSVAFAYDLRDIPSFSLESSKSGVCT